MCFLVYLPVVWLEKLTGMATWNALIAYTLFLNAVSIGFSAYFLRLWPVAPLQRYIILFAFTLATTLFLLNGYGQKDHLIAIGLLPFCLAQLAITYKHNVNRALIWLALIAFIPFLLIKPHYGLLPTALLLQRLWKDRSLKIVLHADFLVLTGGVLTYAALIWVYFQDFIETVLPLSLNIYVASTGANHSYKTMILTILFLGAARRLLHWRAIQKRKRPCPLF